MRGCGPGAGLWAGLGAQGSAQAHLTGLPCLGGGGASLDREGCLGSLSFWRARRERLWGPREAGWPAVGVSRPPNTSALSCVHLRSGLCPLGCYCVHTQGRVDAGAGGSRASAPAVSPRGVFFFLLSPQVAANAYLSQGRLQGWLHLQSRACTWEEK